LLEAEANRRVRMCNLQSAKDCASVKTSLATVHARAQEMGIKETRHLSYISKCPGARTTTCFRFRAGVFYQTDHALATGAVKGRESSGPSPNSMRRRQTRRDRNNNQITIILIHCAPEQKTNSNAMRSLTSYHFIPGYTCIHVVRLQTPLDYTVSLLVPR
jgi:hypothetical protein